MVYIRHTKFSSDPFGDGGDKRSAQIKELLHNSKIDFIDDSFKTQRISWRKEIINFFKALKFIGYLTNLTHPRSLNEIWARIKKATLLMPLTSKYNLKENRVFLWESIYENNYVLPLLLKSPKTYIIGLPHNLESLINSKDRRNNYSEKFNGLKNEFKGLMLCDSIFTISREECWLLRLFGFNAYYFPYYPPKVVEDLMLNIREERQKRIYGPIKKVLLLGSAANPPTYDGMLEIITFYKKYKPDAVLNIAGYQTEKLEEFIPDESRMILSGTLSIDQLKELMIDTDVALIHQTPSTGAVTRVTEMLIAGIPIIINDNASKDTYNLEGIKTYYNFDHLYNFLQYERIAIPPIPEKKVNLDKMFIDNILNRD